LLTLARGTNTIVKTNSSVKKNRSEKDCKHNTPLASKGPTKGEEDTADRHIVKTHVEENGEKRDEGMVIGGLMDEKQWGWGRQFRHEN